MAAARRIRPPPKSLQVGGGQESRTRPECFEGHDLRLQWSSAAAPAGLAGRQLSVDFLQMCTDVWHPNSTMKTAAHLSRAAPGRPACRRPSAPQPCERHKSRVSIPLGIVCTLATIQLLEQTEPPPSLNQLAYDLPKQCIKHWFAAPFGRLLQRDARQGAVLRLQVRPVRLRCADDERGVGPP